MELQYCKKRFKWHFGNKKTASRMTWYQNLFKTHIK